jgi:hypothetical protein
MRLSFWVITFLCVFFNASLGFGVTINVDDYGAVGDGITDDTNSIQTALDYLKTNGGELNFTSGKTYIISSGLELLYYPSDKTYLIKSSDKVKATIKIKDNTSITWGTWGMRLYDSRNITISNICLDGNRQNRSPQDETSGTSLIYLYKKCDGTKLNDLLLINSVMDGIYITAVESDPTTFIADFEMHNCVVSNSYRNNMSIIRGENFKIVGCEFNNANGHDPQAGIDLEPNSGGADLGYSNILIDSCKFKSNNNFGISMSHNATTCGSSLIQDCIFDDNGGGILIGSESNIIKNNIFKNFTAITYRDGIVYFHSNLYSSYNQVFNNSFYNNSLPVDNHLIWLQYNAGEYNSIYGNYFYNYTCGDIYDASAGRGTTQYIYGNYDLTSCFMGYWKLDLLSPIADESDFSQGGTAYNTPALISGMDGNAVSFSSDDKYIKVPSQDTLDISKNITVSAWIKWDGLNNETSYQIFASKNGDWRFGLTSMTNDSAKLGFYASGEYSAGWTETGSRLISKDVWYKVAMTYDGIAARLYLDGELVAVEDCYGSIAGNYSDIYIGALGNNTYSFNGAVDDLKIRHESLNHQEIYDEYAKEKCYRWTLDIDETDVSYTYGSLEAENSNGTLYGSPKYACSVVKQGLDFSPNDKYVMISKGTMNLSSEMTISAWIKWNGDNSESQQIVVGGAADWRFGLISFDDDTAKFGFYASSPYSGGWLESSSRVISKGQWCNIAVTYDGSYTKLYLNGSEIASESASGQLNSASSYLYLGSYSNNTYSFNGVIDDVRVYEHALNSTEILTYYNISQ